MRFIPTGAALVVACALVVAGCSGGGPGNAPTATGPLSSATPSSPAPVPDGPAASDTDVTDRDIAASATVDLTGQTLTVHTDRGAELTGDPVFGGHLSAALAPGQTLAVTVVGRGVAATRAQLDHSVPILFDDDFRFGFGAPQVQGLTDASGALDRETEVEDGQLTYFLSLLLQSDPAEVSVPIGSLSVLSAQWTTAEGGESLRVSPSDWGRTGGMAVVEFGWQSVVEVVPEADSDAMQHQFQCHALGAQTKEFWNLEPWREDVGLLGFVAHRCNP